MVRAQNARTKRINFIWFLGFRSTPLALIADDVAAVVAFAASDKVYTKRCSKAFVLLSFSNGVLHYINDVFNTVWAILSAMTKKREKDAKQLWIWFESEAIVYVIYLDLLFFLLSGSAYIWKFQI